MNIKIESCPKCRREGTRTDSYYKFLDCGTRTYYELSCIWCGYRIKHDRSLAGAVRVWNKRSKGATNG